MLNIVELIFHLLFSFKYPISLLCIPFLGYN